MWAHWEEHSRVITEKGVCRTVKNGAKWERMDKLMIREDFFFSFRSGVQPGLPDLINLSLSREPGRWIQLRLAGQENGTGGGGGGF